MPCEQSIVTRVVECAREGRADVRVVPDLIRESLAKESIEYFGPLMTIALHRCEVPLLGMMTKRVIDICPGCLAFVLVLPLMLVIAVAIKCGSSGEVFYVSERIGKKGRKFGCYKFRTMVADAERQKTALLHLNERDSVLFKIAKDPRVTRAGRILRKYSLDELPQLLNVLWGDMSLVGPRPPLASEVSRYELEQLRRLDVIPGVTGLWQVQSRQDPSFESYLNLDTAYIENWSVWLDLKILVRTIGVVIAGTGA
jgi:exopolysaccharide biosynthesis polyprenyl glycosylphosphotransferase